MSFKLADIDWLHSRAQLMIFDRPLHYFLMAVEAAKQSLHHVVVFAAHATYVTQTRLEQYT